MGKYIVTAKAYDKMYGMVETRRVFKGDKKTAYHDAMTWAYQKAERFNKLGIDFSVTIQGEDWLTAGNVHPFN